MDWRDAPAHFEDSFMKSSFSAIAAIGLGLALACNAAFAQNVTVTQQGKGNTSSTEQVGNGNTTNIYQH